MKGTFLSPDEAAEYLGLTRRGLDLLRGRKDGPAFHKFGHRTIKYRIIDLESWAAARRQPTPTTGTIMLDIIQRVINLCADTYNMRGPLDVVVTDAQGQQLGRRVGESFDRNLPGYASKLEQAWPPFVVEVTDKDGERRAFDVVMQPRPGGEQAPDIRSRLH